jgi:hypothetical protein
MARVMLLDLASLESLCPGLRAHMAAKPNPGGRASSPNRERSERSAPIFDKAFYLLFLFLPLLTLIQTVLARPGERAVAPQRFLETFISGPQWSYTVPFAVRNKTTIEKLIQCESRGMNVSRPDDDGIMSDGILQFHRGPTDTMAGGTWEDFSRASGITGSPKNPTDAIRMTDWAISHGLGPHWGCWRLQNLSPGL